MTHSYVVSVVVAARNESKNLKNLLNDLVNQNYLKEKLEIIIADDRSSDGTWEIISEYAHRFSNVKGIRISKKSGKMTPKKHALSSAISASRGEIILSTDGDCRVPKTWVTSMVSYLGKNTGIVAGFSSIHSQSSVLSKFQFIDFLLLMFANAGAMGMGFFWAGSGQNIAYKKKYFNEIGGFNSVAKKISGDDVYLIQSISKLSKCTFNLSPGGAVTTHPVLSLWQFLNQRIRWASNATELKNTNKLFLIFLVSAFVIQLILLIHIILGLFSLQLLFVFIVKSLFDGIVYLVGSSKLKISLSLSMFFLWSILQPVYIPLMGLMGTLGYFKWKP